VKLGPFEWASVLTLVASGAMGCGAFRCPAKVVSREMKDVLLEDEFKGWFRQVIFAVYSTPRYGAENYATFEQALSGVEL
jgi:uncharacterized protein (TIGR02452 family)